MARHEPRPFVATAEISWLAEHHPAFAGDTRSAVARFAEHADEWPDVAWSLAVELLEPVDSEGKGLADVRFLVPDGPRDYLHSGARFELWTDRAVAVGEVLPRQVAADPASLVEEQREAPVRTPMGFGYLSVALLGSVWTTFIGIAAIESGTDEGQHLLLYGGAVAVSCAVIATAFAFSPRVKRVADIAFLIAGIVALGALTTLAVPMGNDESGFAPEAYIVALGGPVLMMLPGVLSIHGRRHKHA